MIDLNARPGYISEHQARQQGFALPLALIAIALLSVIAFAGYRAVAGAAEVVAGLQDNIRTEQAFFSAEAETTFVFLSTRPVSNGLVTAGGAQTIIDPFGSNVDTEELAPSDFWSASGGVRLSAARPSAVEITYYDATGFFPFATMAEEDLAAVLITAGLKADEAELFAARIGDFQDLDSTRRFRGAERSDYRLYNVAPPTDSPLRTAGELASVLGFADIATPEIWDFIIATGRFGGISTQFKPLLGPPEVAAASADSQKSSFASNSSDLYVGQDTQPTDTARFLLANSVQSGLTRRRAVEIMRTATAADKPFRRIWVYDEAEYDSGPATAANERRNMAPVFQASPDADPR